MTKEDVVKLLTGRDIHNVINPKERKELKAAGLAIIYGVSDDLLEMDGALQGEASCYGGDVIEIDKKGILPDADEVDEKGFTKYLLRRRNSKKVFALHCLEGDFNWLYKTHIPHLTFVLKDENNNDENICQAIVFEIRSLK